jgi:hypothetical protein
VPSPAPPKKLRSGVCEQADAPRIQSSI